MGFNKKKFWIENLERYGGKWLALDEKESIIAFNKSAKSVYKEAVRKGIKIPILFKVPKVLAPYIGGA